LQIVDEIKKLNSEYQFDLIKYIYSEQDNLNNDFPKNKAKKVEDKKTN
jgi:hypothetical protein